MFYLLGNTPCCYDYFYYYSKKAAGSNPNFAVIFLLSLYVVPVYMSSLPVLQLRPRVQTHADLDEVHWKL